MLALVLLRHYLCLYIRGLCQLIQHVAHWHYVLYIFKQEYNLQMYGNLIVILKANTGLEIKEMLGAINNLTMLMAIRIQYILGFLG